MMEKSDKLYRFRSKSQHILVISYLGRRMKVKFSSPFNGVSRYSTRNEVVANQIRKSQAFKNGLVVEDEAIPCNVNPAADAAGTAAKEPKVAEPKNTPAWMQKSVKARGAKAANWPNGANVANVANGMSQSADDAGTGKNASEVHSEQSAGAARANANINVNGNDNGNDGAKVVQEEMFQMTLEDVENYMDAKQYVNEVLHANLTRKEEVKAYCEEHNVRFPNFSFE